MPLRGFAPETIMHEQHSPESIKPGEVLDEYTQARLRENTARLINRVVGARLGAALQREQRREHVETIVWRLAVGTALLCALVGVFVYGHLMHLAA